MSEAITKRPQAKASMQRAGADFYSFGWVSAQSGNLSCRISESRLLITPTGAHLRDLPEGDFVEVDLDGNPVDDKTPSGDVAVHLALYNNIDNVGAVYHIHHLEAALCSDRDQKRGSTHLRDIAMLHALGIEGDEPAADIPVVDVPYQPQEMAETINNAVSDEPPEISCLNVKHHGLYVWGKTPKAARRHVEACAYLFEYALKRPMSPKDKASSITGFG